MSSLACLRCAGVRIVSRPVRPWLVSPRSLSTTPILFKKGNPRGQLKESKRPSRSDSKSSAHDIRPHPEPHHPYEGSDNLGATETAQAGLRTEVVRPGGKGKGKGKKMIDAGEIAEDQVEGGKFDLQGIKDAMAKAVDRLRQDMNAVVGRVGRLTPALLDSVRVEFEQGHAKPLTAFASVSVRDSEHLSVSCYDESYIKPVELALYNDAMNLSPLKQGDGSIVVKVPKPTPETRQRFAKQAVEVSEIARTSIRSVRHSGQRNSKADLDANRITGADHRKDGIALDEEAKRYSKEVDEIEAKAKRILLDR